MEEKIKGQNGCHTVSLAGACHLCLVVSVPALTVNFQTDPGFPAGRPRRTEPEKSFLPPQALCVMQGDSGERPWSGSIEAASLFLGRISRTMTIAAAVMAIQVAFVSSRL